jgi:lipooligosaccharide transport system permease protein
MSEGRLRGSRPTHTDHRRQRDEDAAQSTLTETTAPAPAQRRTAAARSTFDTLAAAVPMLRVTEREARVWRRFWRTSALTGVLMPLLFLGAMGIGLGGLVDDNRTSVEGVDYLVFVAPGILAASAMQGAAGESLWPVMAGMKWVRTFHAAAATPLAPRDVFGGWVLWIAARQTMTATAFVVVAAMLGAVASPWGVLAIPAAVLTGVAFGAPLTAFAGGQDSDVPFPLIMRVAVMPMFLFSGTFFPLSQLPGWLEPVAWVSPLWHGVELCRGATTGSLGWGPAVGHTAFLVACVAAGCWWGIRTFTARLAS